MRKRESKYFESILNPIRKLSSSRTCVNIKKICKCKMRILKSEWFCIKHEHFYSMENVKVQQAPTYRFFHTNGDIVRDRLVMGVLVGTTIGGILGVLTLGISLLVIGLNPADSSNVNLAEYATYVAVLAGLGMGMFLAVLRKK